MTPTVEDLLRELRADVARLSEKVEGCLPVLLTLEMAARELSMDLAFLAEVCRAGIIAVTEINGVSFIAASEIRRIAATTGA